MQIITGKIPGALKFCLYGPEGIGKSTFASKWPDPLFIDTENSTVHMDVRRLPKPDLWVELLNEVDWVHCNPTCCKTLVLDTADWAERLCIKFVCSEKKVDSLEAFPYGKGYVFVQEQFGYLLDKLENVRKKGIHILIIAHAKLQKFEQPDELGAFDRWSMKLSKQVGPMLREWCDALLFANYKTIVVNVDNKGAAKGKNKVQGGKRVMYTTHYSCWDAKNRFGLPDEMDFDYDGIREVIEEAGTTPRTSTATTHSAQPAQPKPNAMPPVTPGTLEALRKRMDDNAVKENMIRQLVADKGHFSIETPIEQYPEAFVAGWILKNWEKIVNTLISDPKYLPF